MIFKVASPSMKEEIIENMKIGFNETESCVRFFFDNKVKLNNCIVCIENNKIISSLHIIPTKIYTNNGLIPVDYVYAATTLPEYRLKGYMSKLISVSNQISFLRGNKASILIPANEKLFVFYNKLGYKNFYKYKKIVIGNVQMKKFMYNANICTKNLSFDNISDIYLKNHVNLGDTIWDKSSVKYAFNMNEFLGGVNVYTNDGYAICYIQKNNTVKIAEFSTTPSDVYNLLGNIYYKLPNHSLYEIILPTNYNHISIEGKVFDHGLIKPYTSELKYFIKKISDSAIDPYFSFTLE